MNEKSIPDYAINYYYDLVFFQRESNTYNKPYLIAALDILGFSNYVMSASHSNYLFDDVLWVLSEMKTIEDRISNDSSAIARFFSDSLFVLLPLDYKKTQCDYDFHYFLRTIAGLVEVALSNGFLIRGGLCIGECSANNTMIWGPGIIKAHLIEEKVANSGRIIIEKRDYYQLNNYIRYVFGEKCLSDFQRYFTEEMDAYYSFDSTLFILECLYADLDASDALRRYRNSLLTIKDKNVLTAQSETEKTKYLSKLSWHIQRYNHFALKTNQPTITL